LATPLITERGGEEGDRDERGEAGPFPGRWTKAGRYHTAQPKPSATLAGRASARSSSTGRAKPPRPISPLGSGSAKSSTGRGRRPFSEVAPAVPSSSATSNRRTERLPEPAASADQVRQEQRQERRQGMAQ